MARKQKAMNSREVGLVIGLRFGKFFFKSDDLHYGFWPDDLPVTTENLAKAQELHSQLILKAIPAGIKRILDVGCGGGALAKRLREEGYHVDCVSPSGPLTQHAQNVLGPETRIIQGRFEDVQLDETYDCILFSESYQYVKLPAGFAQIRRFLRPGGYLLICDFFRRNPGDRGPIRGGHLWERFQEHIQQHPFTCMLDQDITKETARNYELMNALMTEVGEPVWSLVFAYCRANYPRASRFAERLFRKRIAKLEDKYFSGKRTPEVFAEYKSYRLLVYQLGTEDERK